MAILHYITKGVSEDVVQGPRFIRGTIILGEPELIRSILYKAAPGLSCVLGSLEERRQQCCEWKGPRGEVLCVAFRSRHEPLAF